MSLYRTEFQGPEAMLARHNNLALLLRRLMELSEKFGIVIVLTNQVADQVCHFLFVVGRFVIRKKDRNALSLMTENVKHRKNENINRLNINCVVKLQIWIKVRE